MPRPCFHTGSLTLPVRASDDSRCGPVPRRPPKAEQPWYRAVLSRPLTGRMMIRDMQLLIGTVSLLGEHHTQLPTRFTVSTARVQNLLFERRR